MSSLKVSDSVVTHGVVIILSDFISRLNVSCLKPRYFGSWLYCLLQVGGQKLTVGIIGQVSISLEVVLNRKQAMNRSIHIRLILA
jgi:hypothetical protein